MNIDDVVAAATDTYALPEVCTKLRETIDDPAGDVNQIANIISAEPILSAKMLRLANSALFRFANQVETINKALSVLGMEATYNLAMANAASQMKSVFSSGLLDTKDYWYKCLLLGVLGKELAKSTKKRGTERFFVLGILSHMSELVIAANFSAEYQRYLAADQKLPPWQRQIATWGFTFYQASSAICRAWGLPAGLYEPIEKLLTTQEPSKDRDIATLNLAIKIQAATADNSACEDLSLLEPELSLWSFDETEFDDMLDYCVKETRRLQHYF